MLLGSIGLTMSVLGLSLIIQSRVLLDGDDKLTKLGKQLKKLAYLVSIPIGFVLVIIGFLMPVFMESFLSVGVVLIIVSITILVQSQALSATGDKTVSLGRKIRVWAYICAGVGCVTVITLFVRTITGAITA